MNIQISVCYYEHGIPFKNIYIVKVSSLEDVKRAFLKRFGNINASNKANKDKLKVKKLTKQSSSIYEWVHSVNTQTCWNISIFTA